MTELARLVSWLKNLCKNFADIGFFDSGSISSGGNESVKAFPGTQENQMEFESVPVPVSEFVANT